MILIFVIMKKVTLLTLERIYMAERNAPVLALIVAGVIGAIRRGIILLCLSTLHSSIS